MRAQPRIISTRPDPIASWGNSTSRSLKASRGRNRAVVVAGLICFIVYLVGNRYRADSGGARQLIDDYTIFLNQPGVFFFFLVCGFTIGIYLLESALPLLRVCITLHLSCIVRDRLTLEVPPSNQHSTSLQHYNTHTERGDNHDGVSEQQ